MLAAQGDLTLVEGEAAELVLAGERVAGLRLGDGTRAARGARWCCAPARSSADACSAARSASRAGGSARASAQRLAAQMREAELPMARLKTGTPPRLDGRTIDWARLDEQPSDGEPWTMSPLTRARASIRRCSARSPGPIRAATTSSAPISTARRCSPARSARAGPRYCPSIEDKIHRFADRDGHQVFLEPEGLRHASGLSQRHQHLASRRRAAGDAADDGGARAGRDGGAGLCGRIRSHRSARAAPEAANCARSPGSIAPGRSTAPPATRKPPRRGWSPGCTRRRGARPRRRPPLDRANSYMAVMIDDLTLHGVSEPYRMLTARAEYRLRLRANNAATRLTPLAHRRRLRGRGAARMVRSARGAARALERGARSRGAGSELATRACRCAATPGARRLREWLRFGGVDARRSARHGSIRELDLRRRAG